MLWKFTGQVHTFCIWGIRKGFIKEAVFEQSFEGKKNLGTVSDERWKPSKPGSTWFFF